MRVLAISPHLDDAVFSAGGTLALFAEEGAQVTVATVFTRSVPAPAGFALACQLDKGLSAEVDYMALRRAEDAAACAAVGAAPVWLDLPEAPHRGYHSAPALFAPPRKGDTILSAVCARVRPVLDEMAPDVVLAPQAIGAHVDHVQTVRALRALRRAGDGGGAYAVWWWRDFPYVARAPAPAAPFAAAMGRLPERVRALPAAACERKERGCAAYASQIGFQFGGRAGLAARLREAGPAEMFRMQAGGGEPVS